MDLRAAINPRLTRPVRSELEAARRDVLTGIANSDAGRQLLKQLLGPDIYSPIGKPSVVARIYRGSDGLYLGDASGLYGEIIGNARWVKISTAGSRFLTSAAFLTGHLILVEMANKLDRVQATLDALKAGQDDDRLQGLRAAIVGVENALETSSIENRNGLIKATIPMLQDTVYKMIGQLRKEITAVPLPGTNWNPLKNQSEDVRTKLNQCADTFAFCLQGILILSQAYFTLGERETGYSSALRLIGELQDAGIGSAEHKARHLLPRDTEDRPDGRGLSSIASFRS